MLQKVMPTNLTLVRPGSLSSQILDVAPWAFKWALESRLFDMMLKHGGDPNATIYQSDSTTVWTNFVFLSFFISSESSYQERYLRVLDCFISSGADMRITMRSRSPGGSQSRNMTGLDLFLDQLSQISAGSYYRMNHPLLLGVVERILIMAKVTSAEMDYYWVTLENVFP